MSLSVIVLGKKVNCWAGEDAWMLLKERQRQTRGQILKIMRDALLQVDDFDDCRASRASSSADRQPL